MKNYLDLLQNILDNGNKKEDRTGVGTMSIFGAQLKFDLSKGFPVTTTKKIWFKGVAHELLWMLKGDTNIKYLVENGVHIWDAWADKDGNLGPIYGKQWRKWNGYKKDVFVNSVLNNCYDNYTQYDIDQVANVIDQIKKNPNSRRHIVLAWNPAEVDEMKLPSCQQSYQFNVADGKLSCMFTMRSSDSFLGLPWNIASYALLTHMVAQVCGLKVGNLIASLGDVHIYLNHIEQVKEQLQRSIFELPTLKLNQAITNIDDFKIEDMNLENYKCHPAIKAPVAV